MAERERAILSRFKGRVTPELAGKIVQVADALDISPMMLANQIEMESAGTFRANVQNPGSSATGLIQFMDSTKVNLLYQDAVRMQRRDPEGGWEDEVLKWAIPRGRKYPTRSQNADARKHFKAMDEVDQMDYVQLYLEPFAGRINSPQDLAMAIFYPAAIGKSPDWSIADHFRRTHAPEQYEKYLKSNTVRTVSDYMRTLHGRAKKSKRAEEKRLKAQQAREAEEVVTEELALADEDPEPAEKAWVEKLVEEEGHQWSDLYSPRGDQPVQLRSPRVTIDDPPEGRSSTTPMTRRDILVAKGRVGGTRHLEDPRVAQPFFMDNPDYLKLWRKVEGMESGWKRDALKALLVKREEAYYLSERAGGAIRSGLSIAGEVQQSLPGEILKEVQRRIKNPGEAYTADPESKTTRSIEHFGRTLMAAIEGKGYYADPRDVDAYYNQQLADKVNDLMREKTTWGTPSAIHLFGMMKHHPYEYGRRLGEGADADSEPPDHENFDSRWAQLLDLEEREADLPAWKREEIHGERLFLTGQVLGGDVMPTLMDEARDDTLIEFTQEPVGFSPEASSGVPQL